MRQKSLKLNFIFNSILTASGIIFPLITFPYVARVLGPMGTGKVAFATSVVYYFNLIAQLGIPTYGIRACAKVRENKQELSKTVQEIMIINAIMSSIAYICFFSSIFLVPKLYENKNLIMIVGLSILFNSIGVEWLYKAIEKYSYITIRSIVFKFIAILAMFVLVRNQSDYIMYGFITIFAGVGSNVFNFINMRKYANFKLTGSYNLKKHLKPVGIFFAMSVASTIYTQLGIVMLGFMKTDSDVGYYTAAVKIKAILISFVTSLGTVLLPRASYYVEHGLMDDFKRMTKKAINFVFILASSVSIYFILFAKEGIYFLSGISYTDSIVPMQIIMPVVFIVGMTNILGIQMLVPLGKEKYVLYSQIVGAAVNLIINFALIPNYASTGAAIGALAAEISVLIVQMWVLRKMVADIIKQIHWGQITFSLIVAAIAGYLVKFLDIRSNFLMLSISASVFYLVFIILLNLFKEQLVLEIERQIFGKIIRKSKLSNKK